MSLMIPRILVIDDKEEDGIRIAKSIWDMGYAVRFIKYEPEVLLRNKDRQNQGIRVIFMDIDLIGDGITGDGSKIYSVVQQALTCCLNERNGPYVLITWSLHDRQADDLFDYLKERMASNLRPSLCKKLDKEKFTQGTEKDVDLTTKIKEYMQELEATGCLIDWENSVQNAACETIYDLLNIAINIEGKEPKDAIKNVLYCIARAEAGKQLDKHNAVKHLYSLLSQIMYDQTLNYVPETSEIYGPLICSGKDTEQEKEWYNKINAMLHLDFSKSIRGTEHPPGGVFKYPPKGHCLPIPNEDVNKFIRGNFISFENQEEEGRLKSSIEKTCYLLLVEITPSCDYSQKKFTWHRYIIAAMIPLEYIHLIYVVNRKEEKRELGKLPEYLWNSPEFQGDSSTFGIVFNSRLLVSIPKEKEIQDKLGERLFRIKQPLLGDMMGWLSRQLSRLGHVSVS